MTANQALVAALDLAEQQLQAARSGQFDRLLAILPDYTDACNRAMAQIGPDDESDLRTLIATNARVGTLVAQAADDAKTHIVNLRERRTLTSVYLAGDIPLALTADASA